MLIWYAAQTWCCIYYATSENSTMKIREQAMHLFLNPGQKPEVMFGSAHASCKLAIWWPRSTWLAEVNHMSSGRECQEFQQFRATLTTSWFPEDNLPIGTFISWVKKLSFVAWSLKHTQKVFVHPSRCWLALDGGRTDQKQHVVDKRKVHSSCMLHYHRLFPCHGASVLPSKNFPVTAICFMGREV